MVLKAMNAQPIAARAAGRITVLIKVLVAVLVTVLGVRKAMPGLLGAQGAFRGCSSTSQTT
jgi:hypothetical protein